MQRVTRIQDAAAAIDVPTATLRRYERKGLIPPAHRNRAG